MITRPKLVIGVLGLLFLLQSSPLSASDIVFNGGFEGGTYSSTVGGYTNNGVPVGWTANSGFDSYPGYNFVTTTNPHSGSYDLRIGNDDGEDLPTLSQTFSDVSGDTYSGSIWVLYGGAGTGDTLPFFDLSVDGTNHVALNYLASGSWTEYTFSFTGLGSDTLTISGNTSPSEWYVDDVAVNAASSTVTPEPGTLLLFGTFLAGAGLFRLRQIVASSR
jgi:hypothetical protein